MKDNKTSDELGIEQPCQEVDHEDSRRDAEDASNRIHLFSGTDGLGVGVDDG